MPGGWVYIMTNSPHGTLYIGVTADIATRVHAHREGRGSEFCRRHGLTRLVYAERYDDIHDAIAREKAMKKMSQTKSKEERAGAKQKATMDAQAST